MIKTLVLVPERDNEDNPFPPSSARALEWAFVEQFGGWSRRRGVEGGWPMPQSGRVIYDTTTEYVVAVSGWLDVCRWLDLVKWMCRHFRQESMYVEIAGIPDEVSRPDGDQF